MPRIASSSASIPPSPNRLSPGRQIREQIEVAVRAIFASGDASEHAQVNGPVRGGRGDQVVAVAARPAALPLPKVSSVQLRQHADTR